MRGFSRLPLKYIRFAFPSNDLPPFGLVCDNLNLFKEHKGMAEIHVKGTYIKKYCFSSINTICYKLPLHDFPVKYNF